MKILFLSTWFPYPPDQGSKIRAFHLLKALAEEHTVALMSFEDTPIQPEWKAEIHKLCPIVEIVPRQPFFANRLKTWQGWFSPKPSAVIGIYSSEMSTCVSEFAQKWHPDCVVALTFVTAPYALQLKGIPKILDIDNVMSRMLQEAIKMAPHPIERFRRWLAYWKFRNYEGDIYSQFDMNLVVTESDRQDILNWISLSPEQTLVVPNGVDTARFYRGIANPQPMTMVFNGALTYQANFDAMEYFLNQVFPNIIRQVPEVQLKITGKTTGVQLDKLPYLDRVQFTGYLEDIRPTVAGSWVCVTPLRIGGGTRLKILEAMALGTPVVSTTKGIEGLEVQPEQHLLVADNPEEFTTQVLRLLHSSELRAKLAENGSDIVKANYRWSKIETDFRLAFDKIR